LTFIHSLFNLNDGFVSDQLDYNPRETSLTSVLSRAQLVYEHFHVNTSTVWEILSICIICWKSNWMENSLQSNN